MVGLVCHSVRLDSKNDIHKAYLKMCFLKDSSESMNQNSKSHTLMAVEERFRKRNVELSRFIEK